MHTQALQMPLVVTYRALPHGVIRSVAAVQPATRISPRYFDKGPAHWFPHGLYLQDTRIDYLHPGTPWAWPASLSAPANIT